MASIPASATAILITPIHLIGMTGGILIIIHTIILIITHITIRTTTLVIIHTIRHILAVADNHILVAADFILTQAVRDLAAAADYT